MLEQSPFVDCSLVRSLDHGDGNLAESLVVDADDGSRPDRRVPLERMHTHDFALRDAELAIRTLARQVPGEESIHSCLLPALGG